MNQVPIGLHQLGYILVSIGLPFLVAQAKSSHPDIQKNMNYSTIWLKVGNFNTE